jgi:hypothetical protein
MLDPCALEMNGGDCIGGWYGLMTWQVGRSRAVELERRVQKRCFLRFMESWRCNWSNGMDQAEELHCFLLFDLGTVVTVIVSLKGLGLDPSLVY